MRKGSRLKNKAKGELVLKVLEIIEEGAENVLDVFIAYMNSNKRSMSSVDYELKKIRLYPQSSNRDYWSRRFSTMVYQLKKDGLIKKNDNKLLLTVLGKSKLQRIRSAVLRNRFMKFCRKEAGSTLKIVSFDIPEKYKKERGWLRFLLRNLGFSMVQKSLWVGKSKLPEDFLKELERQKIDRYVKVFSVNKKGNLLE